MAVTLQKIAEQAGVSRGTVDRALNNRGRIKPEVEERIKQIAKDLGYQPSRAGRALAMAKRKIKIGFIIQSAQTPFMQLVKEGAVEAKREAESMGGSVRIEEIEDVNAGALIELMEEMRQAGTQGIALLPSEDMLLLQTIDQFAEEYEIPIVTFNADVPGTKRKCFVGQNAKRSGAAAAGLMAEMTGGRGDVAVVSGHASNPALKDRIQGFQQEVEHSYPNMNIVDVRYSYDDDWIAEKIMEEELQQHPSLKGVYITGHGKEGICKAIEKAGRKGSLKVVGHDFLEANLNYLKKGEINFLIGQEAHMQGYEPIMILLRGILDNDWPAEEMQYTDIVIKNRYNI